LNSKPAIITSQSLTEKLFPNREWALVLVLAFEILIFSFTGENFFSRANGFEIMRLGVELGLLALALTPIIITGGIDLSVGSMLGLSAVTFGALWRDFGFPPAVATICALVVGAVGGTLNAALIARLGLPALIVTLGTFSLFRGVAEGVTRGVDNYTGFPESFLFLGQGYLWGILPPQTLVFIVVAIVYWLLLDRSVIGRSLYAIGFSPEGSRFAGLPVVRRVGLVYVLSGLLASLAAIVYVSHLGQAKADAGTGYELAAITAVVLGGTSIFGGRGTITGTLLGLAAIVVLQNGLRLSALPAELTGILTGVLLLVTVGIDRTLTHAGTRVTRTESEDEEGQMRNSQLAILSGVILAAAAIVAVSNWFLVRSFRDEFINRAAQNTTQNTTQNDGAKAITLGMMPKAKGDPYFVSCRQGAEEAAREAGVELIWDGPTDLDPAKQNEVVEGWITRGVNVIAVSVENEAGISTVLRKARERGIKVITWDADAQKDARDFFINQATPQGIGQTLTDEAARIMNQEGEFAIITASLSAANQNEWIKHIRARLEEKYPKIRLVDIRPSDGDRDRAFSEAQTILKVYPGVKVIMAIAAPAVPGAAEAVKQSGRKDVKVTGLSLPNMCKPYVHDGVIDNIVLWNTTNLGYLTVHAAKAVATGQLRPGSTKVAAGRLGEIEVRGDQVMLGSPFIFNKSNIDQFNF
jgi:rhamnose transport system substrate-binding protein